MDQGYSNVNAKRALSRVGEKGIKYKTTKIIFSKLHLYSVLWRRNSGVPSFVHAARIYGVLLQYYERQLSGEHIKGDLDQILI